MPFHDPAFRKVRDDGRVTWWTKNPDGGMSWRQCWVRGAVAWPQEPPDPATGKIEGVFLVGAVDDGERTDDVLRVYAERRFCVIDPVVNRAGKLVEAGPTAWLTEAWRKYGCATYYEHQDEHVVVRWHRSARMSAQIGVPLIFPDAPWKDIPDALAQIEDGLTRCRIEYAAGGEVHEAVARRWRGVGPCPPVLSPALHALACLVVAAEGRRRAALRARREREDE